MSSDRNLLKQVQLGQIASVDSIVAPAAAIADNASRVVTALISDAATAGTAVTETVIFVAPRACTVKSIKVAAPIGVTASDTLYATFTASKRDSAGANSATVATATTKTAGSGGLGTLTAFKPYPLALTAANVNLAAGEQITIAVAKASTGTALTAATSYVGVIVDFEEGTS